MHRFAKLNYMGIVSLAALFFGACATAVSHPSMPISAPPPVVTGSVSSQPPILVEDAQDAAAPESVSDAARGALGMLGGHAGHSMTPNPNDRAPMDHSLHMTMPDAGEQHQSTTDQETEVYTCPMHQDVRSAQPGSCPKCGMTLVRKKKGAE